MRNNVVHRSIPVVMVLAVMAAAAVLVLADRWRRGSLLFGVAIVFAALLRLCLPSDRVGILAVRSRTFDTLSLAAVGGAIVWLSISIDPLGTG